MEEELDGSEALDASDSDTSDSAVPESEAPDFDAPAWDAPAWDAPDSDVPESDAPDSDVPESDALDSAVPESDALDSAVPESDAPDSDAWDSEGSEGAGWFADPDVEGQERYFDGSEWTSETRSAGSDAPVHHLPDHAGELQRALAAATNDIDDVEDRLGSLFDRAQQRGERGGRARQQASAGQSGRAAEGRALAETVEQDEAGGADPGWEAVSDEGADDDDAFADLDEALASEEPEKVKRGGLFKRRS